jgi:CRP/FNR family transcriptional regulator, cyclic AMP receptor protein
LFELTVTNTYVLHAPTDHLLADEGLGFPRPWVPIVSTSQEDHVVDDLSQRLAAIDVFSALSARQLKKLAAQVREVHHDDGHQVSTEGKGALGFHLILDGHAKVSVGGVERRTLGPGDYFGEISLIDGRPRSASIVADGPLHTVVVDNSTFQPLIDESPDFARSLLLVLCARVRALEKA